MSAFSLEAVLIAAAGLAAGIAVAVMAVVQTIRLLGAGRGGLAAAAFAVFLAWLPVSLAALFFLSMFGSAHVAAMHAHEPGHGADATSWARIVGIAYPLLGVAVLWLLARLGRSAARRP